MFKRIPVKQIAERTWRPSFLRVAAMLTVATMVFCSAAIAGDSGSEVAPKQKDWRFFISAYGWLAGIEGSVVNAGNAQDVNVPFSDLAGLAEAGFMLDAEVQWRKWFVNFDGTWATLGAKQDGVLVDLDISIDQTIYDIHFGREIYSRLLDEKPAAVDPAWQKRMRLDLHAGARYFSTQPTIKIAPFVGAPSQIPSTDDRWDPIIGLRFMSALSKRWLITLTGDMGGFGIGDAAQFTWELEGVLGYRITSRFNAFAGYRALSFDLVEGEGGQQNGADLLQHGPLLGVGVNF